VLDNLEQSLDGANNGNDAINPTELKMPRSLKEAEGRWKKAGYSIPICALVDKKFHFEGSGKMFVAKITGAAVCDNLAETGGAEVWINFPRIIVNDSNEYSDSIPSKNLISRIVFRLDTAVKSDEGFLAQVIFDDDGTDSYEEDIRTREGKVTFLV
jgi:hypothetical protein